MGDDTVICSFARKLRYSELRPGLGHGAKGIYRKTLQRFLPAIGGWGLSIAIWSILFGFSGWQYWIVGQEYGLHSTFVGTLMVAEAKAIGFALLTPVIFSIVRRHPAQLTGRYLLSCLVGVAPFMLLCSSIEWMILRFRAEQPAWLLRSGPIDLIHRGFADQIIAYTAIVCTAHAWEYVRKARKEEVERRQIQVALAKSELQVLKMEIRPHFLFNTLHGISTLIDQDSPTAKTMVLKVSNLLRRAIEHGKSDLVPLREEINFIRDYLDLEKMRFGDRLVLNMYVAKDTEQIFIPELILQPLVENAVRYGIASSRRQGWVEIAAEKSDSHLTILIRNSMAGKASQGTGIGSRQVSVRQIHSR